MYKRLFTLFLALICVSACNESQIFSSAIDCDLSSFSPTCPTSSTYTACIQGEVVVQECGDSKICLDGICQEETTNSCTPTTFVPSCVDESTRLICTSQNIILQEACPFGSRCEKGNCVETGNQTCDENSFVPSCVDESTRLICSSQNIILQEACPLGSKCEKGSCVETGDQTCDKNSFVPECVDDTHYMVCRNGLKTTEECIEQSICTGHGICVDACTEMDFQKADLKYVCSKAEGADIYTSKSYRCTQEQDNKYYWVETASQICAEGCEDDQTCKSSVKPQPCDDEYVDHCDNNTFVACVDHEIRTNDCGDSRICAVLNDVGGCFEPCPSALMIGLTEGQCVNGAQELKLLSYVGTDDGKCVTIETNESCPYGCLLADDRCKQHESEGELCDPEKDFSQCSGDWRLTCEFDHHRQANVWSVENCADTKAWSDAPSTYNTCVVVNDRPQCEPKCSAEDVGNPITQCTNQYGDFELVWTCQKSGENYYWDSSYVTCLNGCNADGTACERTYPEENTYCNSEPQTKCATEHAMLYCDEIDAGEMLYRAVDCSENFDICDDGKCVGFCTQAEYESNAGKTVCSYNNDITLETYQCHPYADGDYRWEYVASSSCKHGCDKSTNECTTFHKDEGKACSNDESDEHYYPSRCDGKLHLRCNGYLNQVEATKCSDSCHDDFGCYAPCDTLHEVKYECSSYKHYDEYYYDLTRSECMENKKYAIKYWEYETESMCDACFPKPGGCY